MNSFFEGGSGGGTKSIYSFMRYLGLGGKSVQDFRPTLAIRKSLYNTDKGRTRETLVLPIYSYS